MSNSRLQSSGKSGNAGSTIGFRFHANEEELEELQAEQKSGDDKKNELYLHLKLNTPLLTEENLNHGKSGEEKSEPVGDAVRDHRNLLGRRSTSVDSNYESPFSNPIETWRKLNVLKEKLTKTVEEKISEMKIDRNRARLISSKENSSISDSEDTSESSRVSEAWRDAEDLNSSSLKQSNENLNASTNALETALLENVKKKMESKESDNELRNRKTFAKVSDLINLPEIKIATAKTEIGNSLTPDSLEEVESGVEADENLDGSESDSVDFFEETITVSPDGGSPTPPGGNYFYTLFLNYSASLILNRTFFAVVVLSCTFYFFIPMPDFIKGFVLCFLLMMIWDSAKSYVQGEDASLLQQKSFVMPDYSSLPPLKVPHVKSSKGVWMNEYEREFYDPDYYSVTQTLPAFVELDNSILKISRPKGKINKRATFDEPEYKFHFISQRVYNISGCNVFLMPDGLTRKRLFSKKYPIVIFLKPDSLISEKIKGKEAETPEGHVDETTLSALEPVKNKSSLYLFARCDRQKEEWYRRLLAASRLSSTSCLKKNGRIPEVSEDLEKLDESPEKEPCTPFEHLFFDDDVAETEEYLRYMAKFVDEEADHFDSREVKPRGSWYSRLKIKKKDGHGSDEDIKTSSGRPMVYHSVYKKTKHSTTEDHEKHEEGEHEEHHSYLQVQWFNAFINRILFDVFRSPYWLDKIHEKVQKKLNSIRLPYYIEDIEVIELDLGKTGPVFHRVSQPYIDERGLWFDMDTTFDGLIKVTIQTHLNLIKLQNGMEEEASGAQLDHKTEKEKEHKKEKEREVKDTHLIKDSKEKSKETVARRKRKLDRSHSKPSSLLKMDAEEEAETEKARASESHPDLECKSSEDYKLIDEVAEFAEIVVEETLAKSIEKDSKQDVESTNLDKTLHQEHSRSPIYDSELEDSAESSDEEEELEEEIHQPVNPPTETEERPVSTARRYPKNRRSSKKIFRVFENVAQSKYFKSVAQSKYVKKAIAGVSATKLRLSLEIKSCTGILTINIPPPPSDRFWYGFREMPTLVFSASPKIGDKPVRFVHIKNYLQKKILHELKKVMVAPNMIDFVLPTSSPARSSSSPHIEQPDLNEQEATPPDD